MDAAVAEKVADRIEDDAEEEDVADPIEDDNDAVIEDVSR